MKSPGIPASKSGITCPAGEAFLPEVLRRRVFLQSTVIPRRNSRPAPAPTDGPAMAPEAPRAPSSSSAPYTSAERLPSCRPSPANHRAAAPPAACSKIMETAAGALPPSPRKCPRRAPRRAISQTAGARASQAYRSMGRPDHAASISPPKPRRAAPTPPATAARARDPASRAPGSAWLLLTRPDTAAAAALGRQKAVST